MGDRAIVLASGKRGVLASGKAAISDASGICDDCCGAGCDCPTSFLWAWSDSISGPYPYVYPSPGYSDTITITNAANCWDEITITGASDDIVVLMRPDDSITVNDTGFAVTITLPAQCLILRNTRAPNNYIGTVYGLRSITVRKGACSHTWYAGDPETDNYVSDMDASGITTHEWGALSLATLDAAGLIDDNGTLAFKFGWIGDDGYADVQGIACDDSGI